jgi:dihydroorotate dehydrogenase electron transfer subunit
LVAGGRGVAPLLHLAETHAELHPDGLLLYGAEDAGALFPTEESPYPVYRSTIDGSIGQHGTVLDLLRGMLERGAIRQESSSIYGCGPTPMLAGLSRLATDRSIPVQVSLETTFGCGTGLCAGCAIPLLGRDGQAQDAFDRYAFACTDGPVFDWARVDWMGVCD